MCSFGLSRDCVRAGAFHYRTLASVLTLPITLAVVNENYRYVLGIDGCYQTVEYPYQELLNNLYYIEYLGGSLIIYVSALLVILIIICYCCRKNLYQLLRICGLVFIVKSFVLCFLAVFFLLANAVAVRHNHSSDSNYDKTGNWIHFAFAIVSTISTLEIEWILLCPLICKVRKHRENMKLLSRYQTETRNLKPDEVAQVVATCRMVAFLRGLRVRRQNQQQGLLQYKRGCKGFDGYISEIKEIKLPSTVAGELAIELSNSVDEEKRVAKERFQEESGMKDNDTAIECTPSPETWKNRPLEALTLDPLFDPRILNIINQFQSSPENIEGIPLEDYLHYRLWRDCDEMKHNEIQRIRRKLQKHRWKVWDEKKKLEITPILI
eukprot:jgi/Bigna1/87216/estExt_fgenesh1_pg.C_180002